MATYRRPGVYLEETLLAGPNDVGSAEFASMFVGVAERGPSSPVRCNSWTDYVSSFGAFSPPAGVGTTYLPFAVYSYFQNGGRVAWVARATPSSGSGATAEFVVCDHDSSDDEVTFGDKEAAFTVKAKSEGVWGNDLAIGISAQEVSGSGPTAVKIYTLTVFKKSPAGVYSVIETFTNLSLKGDIPGTRKADAQINDSVYGSRYITITDYHPDVIPEDLDAPASAALIGGADNALPNAGDISASLVSAIMEVDTPLTVNAVGYRKTNGDYVLPFLDPSQIPERSDVFIINDAAEPRALGVLSSDYATGLPSTSLGTNGNGSSFVAAYTPWITIANPAENRGTILVPPGGSVAGVIARTDATRGIFQSPAGTSAVINNAISTDARFSTTEQGTLNSVGINVIRPVPNSGIAIMGGRTRKQYGVDRYISARRTIIYIKESLRVSTQFAVFENNSQLLWSRLRAAADNILRPIWNSGGLHGDSAAEAYFIVCDESINTPDVIAAGEVRMNVGVALEYPAEFVVIQISQFDVGSSSELVSA